MSILGLFLLNRLTKKKSYKLRVELETFDGSSAYGEYLNFAIGYPISSYRLHISGFSGTAGFY